MGVRREEGKDGMGRIVIDRRPRKSVPIRSQYREFGSHRPDVRLTWLLIFLVLAAAHTAFAIIHPYYFGFPYAYAIGVGAAMFGAGFFLHALMYGRKT